MEVNGEGVQVVLDACACGERLVPEIAQAARQQLSRAVTKSQIH